jgi:hypothetical protein
MNLLREHNSAWHTGYRDGYRLQQPATETVSDRYRNVYLDGFEKGKSERHRHDRTYGEGVINPNARRRFI